MSGFSLNEINEILVNIETDKGKNINVQKCKRCGKKQEYKSYWDNNCYRVLCHECRAYNKQYLKNYNRRFKATIESNKKI